MRHPHVRSTDAWSDLEGVRLYAAHDADGVPIAGPRVALVALMHGNEPVGARVLERLALLAPERMIAGEVLAVHANLAAGQLRMRHTPEGEDMNRLWDRDHLSALAKADPASLSYEQRRALELAPALLTADVLLDLHSTSRPSPLHLVFRDDLAHVELAERLGVGRLVTGVHEAGILDGGLCSNVGLLPGERSDRIGFTLEAGQHENAENLERAWGVVQRLLAALGMWSGEVPDGDIEIEVFDVVDRFRQAPEGSDPWRFVGYEGGEPGGGRHGPPRQLESFEEIEADEVLLLRGSDTTHRATGPFTMLMPAPTADPGTDLYYLTQRRHTALRRRPRDDREARLEAEAVERMLDMLSDDAYQRGTTFTTSSPRLTLDLCGELAARTARLPPGHPHRRITVVGRGDHGGDETERRNGTCYRRAMRHAMSAGVPVDRIQLMRGAAFGWFDILTRRGAGARLTDAVGSDRRLFVSMRQPHTVSVLIAGDLDKAMADADFRHARVALVIEAATVEPDGASTRSQIARTGIFGSRPELLGAAASLIRELKAEHGALMHKLSHDVDVDIADFLDEEGALAPQSVEQVERMRRLLYALHLRSWRELLAQVVTEPRTLRSPREVGCWLARTMASTGIYDAASLEALLLDKAGDVWRVTPMNVGALPRTADGWVPAPRVRNRIPGQPVVSGDVGRDNIERWLGWKRFLREAQPVPDTRGKDVDLAFHDAAAELRVARWFRDARELAAPDPEARLVVVAGDGLGPRIGGEPPDPSLVLAHREMMADPSVRCLRIQHIPGSCFGWLKDLVEVLCNRSAGGPPMSLSWEMEHGSSVSVVLMAHRESTGWIDPWSLEGWTIDRCGVLLTDRRSAGSGSHKVAMFTEPMGDRCNLELIHFGRGHCEGLLRQSAWRLSAYPSPALRVAFDGALRELLARWVVRVRTERESIRALPAADRAAAVTHLLGLRDLEIAEGLVRALDDPAQPSVIARRIWRSVEPWSGG